MHVEILLLERTGRGLKHHDDLGGKLETSLQRSGLSIVGDRVGLAHGDGGLEAGLERGDIDAGGGFLHVRGELLLVLGGLERGDEVGDVGHYGGVVEGCDVCCFALQVGRSGGGVRVC